MKYWFLIGLALFCQSCLTDNLTGTLSVIYPKQKSDNDDREKYRYELLDQALRATVKEFGEYSLEYSRFSIPNRRLDIMVAEQREINVFSSATSIGLEHDLLPVKIPILKGVLGLRILFIRKETQKLLGEDINSKKLRSFSVGQGLGWADVEIFERNDFNVMTASNYEALFRMLKAKRFDIFPRGVNEIFKERSMLGADETELAIEKNLLLHYPFPVYFFVSKQNESLAKRIESGLRIMKANGSFEQLFQKYHHEFLAKAQLEKRKLIFMDNPLLPKNMTVLKGDYLINELPSFRRGSKL